MASTAGLSAEVQALLHLHLPAAINELESYVIETCRYFDLKIPGMSHTDLILRQIPVYLQGVHNASHATVKCDGLIYGSEIREAKMTIQLPRTNKAATIATYHTGVSPEHSWRLQQLQDAGNYVASALAVLRSRDRCTSFSGIVSKANGSAPLATFSSPLFSSLADASAFLNRVLILLMKGLNTLCTPPTLRLTTADLLSLKSRQLNPPLPDDVCLSMHIQTDKLVLTLYQVPQQVVTNALASQQRRTSASLIQAVPPPLHVQPIIRLSTEVTVAHFERLVAEYRRAVAACHSLVDKVTILSQYTDGIGKVVQPECVVES